MFLHASLYKMMCYPKNYCNKKILVGEYWTNKLQYIPSSGPQIPDSSEHNHSCPVGPRDWSLPRTGPGMEDYFTGMNY